MVHDDLLTPEDMKEIRRMVKELSFDDIIFDMEMFVELLYENHPLVNNPQKKYLSKKDQAKQHVCLGAIEKFRRKLFEKYEDKNKARAIFHRVFFDFLEMNETFFNNP